jgi:hypothetical protein
MSSIGLNKDWSSREGKRTDMNPCAAGLIANSGEPHSAQKLRTVRLPLLPRTAWVAGVPVTVTSVALTTMPEAKGAPLERWQSRQWQLIIATGAPVHT